jgi:hypothetical protein
VSSSTGRRYLDWIHVEISLALDRRVSRYALWLAIWELGGDPDRLSREEARRFVEAGLTPFLESQSAPLSDRARRRLAARILRFDPRFPTPEEWLACPRPGRHPDRPRRPPRRHSSP